MGVSHQPIWKRSLLWWAAGAACLALPYGWGGGTTLSMLSQMGIAVVACLSYNLLLGQGGMLSFGHAVYVGAGAYAAIHLLKAIGANAWPVPVGLLPLLGGLASVGCAAILGFLSTRKAGTPFAMITLGLAELVSAVSLMFPGVFGGDAGVSANRVVGAAVWGITWGPQREVYALIAAYTAASVGLVYAFTQTPLGRLLNAVRDNPERVAYIGFSAPMVRYLAFMASAFFAGVAGGLGALHFEIVTPEVLGPARSAGYLLFTFIGGTTYFWGPVVGGVLMVLATVWMSAWTQAWLLYLGLLFVLMVMYAPGGVAGWVVGWIRSDGGLWERQGWLVLFVSVFSALLGLVGAAVLIEMTYHLQLQGAVGTDLRFLGRDWNTASFQSWGLAGTAMVGGWGLFEALRRKRAAVRSAQSTEREAKPAHGEAS